MNRNLTCIICPRGCTLTVDTDSLTVSGNACPKGAEYGIAECTDPVRTVTSVIRISNRPEQMVSVKTATPIKKSRIFEVMDIIRNAEAAAPIAIGDVLLQGVCGSDIIATKGIQ